MKQLKSRFWLLILVIFAAVGCGQSLVEFPLGAAPRVLSTIPVDDAEGVSLSNHLSATFSTPMDGASINSETFFLMQGSTPISATVTYGNGVARLTPMEVLKGETIFTATVAAGVTDKAGNPMVDDYAWTFTTKAEKESTPPSVLSVDPANGATSVALNTSVKVVFSEAMDPATVEPKTFTLKEGVTLVEGSVTYEGTTATFTPNADLLTNTDYVVTVSTAALDLAGNALATNFISTFSTGNPPVVITTNPVNGAFGVAIDRKVEARFDVAMDPATINESSFTLRQGATPIAGTVTYDGIVATFAPSNDYPTQSILTATLTKSVADFAGNTLLKDFVWTFQTGVKLGQGQVPLGSASDFAILAFNTVTNVNNPGTIVVGNVGISPGAALIGFPPGEVNGSQHLGDAVAAEAQADVLIAYNDAAGRLGAAVLPGDLSGLTFYPGLYKNSTSVMLSAGNFTLDAQGDANAVFIFQMGSTLTSNPGTQIVLSGGAKATNIYWSVGTSATLGTNSIFKGTIIASSAITMNTGATIEGRLLALSAAVALDTNPITVPAH